MIHFWIVILNRPEIWQIQNSQSSFLWIHCEVDAKINYFRQFTSDFVEAYEQPNLEGCENLFWRMQFSFPKS